jgi:hypothetical protein
MPNEDGAMPDRAFNYLAGMQLFLVVWLLVLTVAVCVAVF